jgi:hypothetical protein
MSDEINLNVNNHEIRQILFSCIPIFIAGQFI